MSMVIGQKVVCIDDTFKPLIKILYKHLPKAGSTYTVRSVYLGRSKVVGTDEHTDVGILLKELVNPPDPRAKTVLELGFSESRFRPLEELTSEHEVVVEEEIFAPIS